LLKGRCGFTLFELLVVLAITAIITLLSLPTFLNFIQEYRLTATAQDLLYNLQYARSVAIEKNQNVYITFSTATPWCYGINLGSACTCGTPTSCSNGAFSDPRSTADMTLSTLGLSSNSLIFEGTRGATTNGKSTLTFTVSGGATNMSVGVTNLGNMQLCSTNVSGYSVCP
jgi:prepilin-type N-terminal cleavage/methylation domain-containing protein